MGDYLKDCKNVDLNTIEEYDFGFPLTHESGDAQFSGVIKRKNYKDANTFSGLFSLEGFEGGAIDNGGYNYTFIPRRGRVAAQGDRDLNYVRATQYIKDEFPDVTEDQFNVLCKCIIEDKSLYRIIELRSEDVVYDYDALNPLSNLISGSVGEVEWALQNIRGLIAIDQDFDAITMNDENGTSYLIPVGSRALYLGKVKDYDQLEQIKKQISLLNV